MNKTTATAYGALAVFVGALGGTAVFVAFFRGSSPVVLLICILLAATAAAVAADRLLFG